MEGKPKSDERYYRERQVQQRCEQVAKLLTETEELLTQDGLQARAMDIDEARKYVYSAAGWDEDENDRQ